MLAFLTDVLPQGDALVLLVFGVPTALLLLGVVVSERRETIRARRAHLARRRAYLAGLAAEQQMAAHRATRRLAA